MSKILIAGLPTDVGLWLQGRLDDVAIESVPDAEAMALALRDGAFQLLVVDHTVLDSTALLGQVSHQPTVILCVEGRSGDDRLIQRVQELEDYHILMHPLDREELARLVALSLGRSLLPPGHEMDARKQQLAVQLAEYWNVCRDNALERVAVLQEAAVAALNGLLDRTLAQEAQQAAHKLAGLIGSFGFRESSRLAREVELLLGTAGVLERHAAVRVSELVVAIRQDLERSQSASAADRGPVEKRPVLLIVDQDLDLVQKLTTEANTRGIRSIMARDVAIARYLVAQERPDAVLLDVPQPDEAEEENAFVVEMAASRPPIPVLVSLAEAGFLHRIEMARLGASVFLQKPLLSAQVFESVSQVLEQSRASASRVLVVDDDAQLLETLRIILAGHNLQVTTLEDPLRFWDVLEQSAPDLLVMDVDMPHMSGIELCRVVRLDPRWSKLPVLFLTAHTDRDTVHRVFAAGADDFVGKPVVGPELLNRIVNRLERSHLLRTMAETDFLTGVPNRHKANQVLTHFMRLATRQKVPLSFTILDIDHFKQVNDTHGHLAGDWVLRTLGQLLLRSFRGEDVVGRWGGEEFIVGMYGMAKAGAVTRMNRILETMRQEDFTDPDGTSYHVTFSAGVAEFPADGADLQALFRASDAALYVAKENGRNQVLAASQQRESEARCI